MNIDWRYSPWHARLRWEIEWRLIDWAIWVGGKTRYRPAGPITCYLCKRGIPMTMNGPHYTHGHAAIDLSTGRDA